jgi:uncharacterized repeat protein (TIGR04138 family)
MGHQREFEEKLKSILKRENRYHPRAYEFLLRALSFTQKRLNKDGHVTGRELLDGIKDLALTVYGPMAKRVLESWGIRKTDDWGEIVFALVKEGALGKTSRDTKEEFKNVYDFEEVFVRDYRYRVSE